MDNSGELDEERLQSKAQQAAEFSATPGPEIARTLQSRAAFVTFSPELREQILQNLPAQRKATPLYRQTGTRHRVVPALALAAALLLLLGLVIYVVQVVQPPRQQVATATIFARATVLGTPAELAHGGQLISLDPTGQHIVYGIKGEAGVMYTTDLANPIARNELAMKYARDVSWAPDGSALVTTIYPADETMPLLALVRTGHYMQLLGTTALAASWYPSAVNEITYITRSGTLTTLWSITPDGKIVKALNTFTLPLFPQQLSWSPDGRWLAILATPGNTPTAQLIQRAAHAIYLFDPATNKISELVTPGNSSIGSLAWSSDGKILAYEQTNAQGQSTLHALNLADHQALFTLDLHHALLGMSWSPDNRTLVYSDGGVLRAHTLSGGTIQFSSLPGLASAPFWLDNQHILYLATNQGTGQLTLLAARTSKTTPKDA